MHPGLNLVYLLTFILILVPTNVKAGNAIWGNVKSAMAAAATGQAVKQSAAAKKFEEMEQHQKDRDKAIEQYNELSKKYAAEKDEGKKAAIKQQAEQLVKEIGEIKKKRDAAKAAALAELGKSEMFGENGVENADRGLKTLKGDYSGKNSLSGVGRRMADQKVAEGLGPKQGTALNRALSSQMGPKAASTGFASTMKAGNAAKTNLSSMFGGQIVNLGN